jgi:hypothetical protein
MLKELNSPSNFVGSEMEIVDFKRLSKDSVAMFVSPSILVKIDCTTTLECSKPPKTVGSC